MITTKRSNKKCQECFLSWLFFHSFLLWSVSFSGTSIFVPQAFPFTSIPVQQCPSWNLLMFVRIVCDTVLRGQLLYFLTDKSPKTAVEKCTGGRSAKLRAVSTHFPGNPRHRCPTEAWIPSKPQYRIFVKDQFDCSNVQSLKKAL